MTRKQLALIIQTIVALILVEILVLASTLPRLQIERLALNLPAVTARQFLLTFLASTALLLFLVRRARQRMIFEIIFILSIFSGVWFIFALAFPTAAPAIAALLAALRYVVPYVLIQNLVLILGIAGIGSALGSATPWQTAAIVLAFLALYDVIAVYGTRHMVTMFKRLVEKGVIFALVIPEQPRRLLTRMKEVAPGEGFFFLGSGDLVLPAFFIASAARQGWGAGMGAAAGALAGLFFTDLLFQWGRKQPMPALPPIVLGTLAGFFIAMLMIRSI